MVYMHNAVNGHPMNDCVGVASEKQVAKNNAAKLLSDNKRLVSTYIADSAVVLNINVLIGVVSTLIPFSSLLQARHLFNCLH